MTVYIMKCSLSLSLSKQILSIKNSPHLKKKLTPDIHLLLNIHVHTNSIK